MPWVVRMTGNFKGWLSGVVQVNLVQLKSAAQLCEAAHLQGGSVGTCLEGSRLMQFHPAPPKMLSNRKLFGSRLCCP